MFISNVSLGLQNFDTTFFLITAQNFYTTYIEI